MNISDNTTSLLGALGRHNTVSALRIADPLEKQPPESGQFVVAGPEGPIWFDASNRVQKGLAEKVVTHERLLEDCSHLRCRRPPS